MEIEAPVGGSYINPGSADFGVALVCMPFALADRPSLQMGLISALAEAAGYRTDVFHFNVDLAAELGPDLYERLCCMRGHMAGEWLFSCAAFGGDAPDPAGDFIERYPDEFGWAQEVGKEKRFFVEMRNKLLPAFVDQCAINTDWSQYRVVGFSSMFQQNTACLALAQRIKAQNPEVQIVFGGANMEGDMGAENLRAFEFIDFVCSGEADDAFPALLHRLANSIAHGPIPGVLARTSTGTVDGGPPKPVRDMDRLPIPLFEPYFERVRERGLAAHYSPTWVIPYESARGCWWGQKHHCTFCGLNGETIGYRAKSPSRVLTELAALAETYDICDFTAVDNILPMNYIRKLFGEVHESKLDYRFFYEVKSNLTRDQIQRMFYGGVRRVQPGIESLSTHVLRLMQKGSTMLENVRCLKWCRYYNIHTAWNLLWGFPGETEDDYVQELETLRSISHLQPPDSLGRIWLERFSPMYTDPTYPIRQRRPASSYDYVYPPYVDLNNIAYFFDYDIEDTVSDDVHRATIDFLRTWRENWTAGNQDVLSYRRTASAILIDEKRGTQRPGTYRITGPSAEIYEFCTDTMRTPAEVAEHLRSGSIARECWSAEDIRGALDAFCDKRLMLRDGDQYFSLALPANPAW